MFFFLRKSPPFQGWFLFVIFVIIYPLWRAVFVLNRYFFNKRVFVKIKILLIAVFSIMGIQASDDRSFLDFKRIEREEKTKSPLLRALGRNDYDEFYKLLSDPKTDVNAMFDDKSLLHFVYYRHNRDNGLNLLRATLDRKDLQVDQKGNGIGDCGDTTLGMAIRFLVFLTTSRGGSFYDQQKVNNSLSVINMLIEKGASKDKVSLELQKQLQNISFKDDVQAQKVIQFFSKKPEKKSDSEGELSDHSDRCKDFVEALAKSCSSQASDLQKTFCGNFEKS